MTNFKNKAIWFWGFIILLILNISAFSTMFYFAYKMHHHGEYHTTQEKTWNSRINSVKKGNFKKGFWGQLNLTEEQQSFVKMQRKEHFSKMKIINANLRKLQILLFEEIRLPEPDYDKVQKYKAETLDAHKAIIEETLRFYEQLKTKLSEEQMIKINSHFSKHFHSNKTMKSKTMINNNSKN